MMRNTRISLIVVLLAPLLSLAFPVLALAQVFPAPSPVYVPIPLPSFVPGGGGTTNTSISWALLRLGGLSLNDYCISLGQTGVKLTSKTWSCQPSGTPVDFNKACQFQYKNPNATGGNRNRPDPFRWECFAGDNDFGGQYFDNQTFSGTPKLDRVDQKINFNFGEDSPASVIPNDHFSVRWTRRNFIEAGKYSFTIKADDGIRFKIDNTVIIDDLTNHATKTYTPDIMIRAGVHTYTIDYFENTGSAVAIFNEDFPARDRTSPSPIIIP